MDAISRNFYPLFANKKAMYGIGASVLALGAVNTFISGRTTEDLKKMAAVDAAGKDALWMSTISTGLGIGTALAGVAVIAMTMYIGRKRI